ncbi:MAG TPA: protein-disulfide reductase DsbD domain-containing protein [bacterium]|nr:protein-disulfide reductase DsbD domain-containing protein [bacterium]
MAAKRFHPKYRIRDTGAGLLASALGIEGSERGPEAAAENDAVGVRAYFSSPEFRPFQVVPLTVELMIKKGWHVYTAPVPDGYSALSADLAPLEGLGADTAVWPDGHAHHVEGLDEAFSVLDGTIRGRIPVTFAVAAGAGDQRPEVVVRFQACSDTACLPPATVRLSPLIREAALAD